VLNSSSIHTNIVISGIDRILQDLRAVQKLFETIHFKKMVGF
jgi:hypothetical protein